MANDKGHTVFFDVETQRLIDEVGGWHHIARLGLAAAVTYNTADGLFRHYTEAQVADLIAELQAADLVVGFNVLRFDYEVLRPYTHVDLQRLPTVDMLAHIYQRLGFRVSLGALAEATLGTDKSADGVQAVHWYRQGRIDKVLAYCQQDVAVTRDLYRFGQQNRYVQYRDRYWRLQRVAVNW
ncbi:MAG: ribonuclease H-like domain-containing protein [Anaerolineae bacterium]|nr:ribonuclease H-like domain-containing protein [Anaerolineae bacterium]